MNNAVHKLKSNFNFYQSAKQTFLPYSIVLNKSLLKLI